MLVSTKAIVISTVKYSEADLIAKLFTENFGLKTYLVRRVLKSKKGKIRTSQFQPLTQLDIVAYHKDKGTLEYLREVKVAEAYKTLHTNLHKATVVMFLSEMLKNTIQEEESNPRLFTFLKESLLWFDRNDTSNFHLLFLLKLSRFLGFYPDTSNNEKRYFNMLDGRFEDSESNSYCISGQVLDGFKGLLGIDFDAIKKLILNQTKRSELMDVLLSYYSLHIEGFKTPKSLPVLKEIFS